MHKALRALAGLILLSFATNVRADDDGNYTNYDSIVNELRLSAAEEERVTPPPVDDSWQDVAVHGGLGFATSLVSVTSPNGTAGAGLLKGFQFGFGLNLFDRAWRAEGVFSSYSPEELDQNLKADLKEFELRVVYLPPLNDNMILRFGAGLAARYMNIDVTEGRKVENYQASTPSSVFLVGFERRINKNIALGPDLSYRSAIVSDTFDKSAWDASFRLNATF